MSVKDVQRAKVEKAVAIFILCRDTEDERGAEDAANFLRVSSFRISHDTVPIFAMAMLPENKKHIQSAGANAVVCSKELKLNILSRSCVAPGASIFLHNLIRSELTVDSGMQDWLEEYCHGSSHEMYMSIIPSTLDGFTFAEAVMYIFDKYDCLLIGVHGTVEDPATNTPTAKVMINPPPQFRVRQGWKTFMICTDVQASSSVANDSRTSEKRTSNFECSPTVNMGTDFIEVDMEDVTEDRLISFPSNSSPEVRSQAVALFRMHFEKPPPLFL